MTQYIISANLPEILTLEDAGKQEEAYALAHTKIGEQLQDALQCMAEAKAAGGGDNALVIDGKALLHGLAHDLKGQLLQASSAHLFWCNRLNLTQSLSAPTLNLSIDNALLHGPSSSH